MVQMKYKMKGGGLLFLQNQNSFEVIENIEKQSESL